MAAATVLGLLLGLAGATSSGFYAWSAAMAVGEIDRSVVFWYSGFLVFGVALTAGGISLLLVLTSDPGRREPVFSRKVVRACTWILAVAGGLAAAAGAALAGWHLLVT